MTLVDILMVGIGGFFGAVIRYLISKNMNHSDGIPTGTLLVNLIGSLLIGIVFGMELSRMWTLLIASGLAGALTTYSTVNKELIRLWKNNHKNHALIYFLLTYGGGLTFAAIGYKLF
ncbi:fluoride efflux transporter CrcB [Sporosarcina limicola]|uniref:Fluoride-specific ion channel FluC n=1 Tax=Sporosarcina limicola TaxID=34101 RepID=A0A927MK61_9BACL|nr:fluoride efflux transporter CrcB [Sporosarcina limicola]MBE1555433.1 CrcB protein [Sporosarcina limicola]